MKTVYVALHKGVKQLTMHDGFVIDKTQEVEYTPEVSRAIRIGDLIITEKPTEVEPEKQTKQKTTTKSSITKTKETE